MKIEEIKKLAKEKYNLSGIVYIFENGNIFTIEAGAKRYSEESKIPFEVVDLDEKKEIETKKNKK